MNHSKSVFRIRPATSIVAVLLALFILSLSSIGSRIATASEIAQLPLFLPPPVSPNILFVLDDSGSMKYEILPDDYTGTSSGQAHVFPRAAGVYNSTSDYANYVATIALGNAYGALARSYYWNKTFYNPSITYTPWSKWDKTLYPNASPTCALHNPERPGTGTTYCRDLTVNLINWGTTYWFTTNFSTTSSTTTLPRSDFLAATYYSYDVTQGDAGKLVFSNYTEHQIKPTTTSYTGEGRDKRTDCAGGVCTYAQEIQNFANWYTYYRSRVLASRAGIGQAFAKQPLWTTEKDSRLRVGFGSINTVGRTVDGVSGDTVIQGLRNFWGTGRQEFYSSLYDLGIPAQGTPLVKALQGAGRYYQRTDSRGPWSKDPATASSDTFASCRQSFTILMTDGYWNGSLASGDAAANNDGTNGPTITGPNNQSYTYSATSPFTDSRSNTLADVAMYYWKNDLMPNLTNQVPITDLNPAFWQHMVTFGVGLGVTGSIDPIQAFAAISANPPQIITWPDPSGTSSTPAKIDDLLHASVNGRGGFFSAADPNTFANKLADVIDSIRAQQKASATSLATNSARRTTNSMLYQALFENIGSDWRGELRAFAIESNGSVANTPTWSTNESGKIPAAASRKIYTTFGNNSSDKVAFEWSALSTTQQAALTAQGVTQDVLNWIRGDQTNERPDGPLRKRARLLGDIINSDPAYVAEPLDFGYGALPGYTAFRQDKKDRAKMLYVGANDGMLHAFDALTGEEKFAFIPHAAHANLANLVDPDYEHRYFVDGAPYVADAYLGSVWKSVLIGTMGAGGRAVFALDVTEPVSSTGAVNFNTNNILWEFSDPDLGYTFGQPSIGRLQNGTWVVVFGNGYGSASGYDAYLFVVNLETGALIAKIGTGTTGSGDAATPNGLSSPALLGDGNRNLVAAYAGDLKGNLWKFDLTGTLSNSTMPAFNGTPLFKARSTNNAAQPITAPLEISKHPKGGYLILFGTGKYFDITDNEPETNPVQQSLYGIWDSATLDSSNLWSGGSAITATDRSILQVQTILQTVDASGNTWRVVSQNPVDWNTQRGWYLDLLPQTATKTATTTTPGDLSERVVDTPILHSGRVFFTTRIQFKPADPCDPVTGSGWLMGLDLMTGGRKDDVFDVNGDRQVDDNDHVTTNIGGQVSASGLKSRVGLPRPPSFLNSGTITDVYMPGSGVNEQYIQQTGISNPNAGRQSWRQLR